MRYLESIEIVKAAALQHPLKVETVAARDSVGRVIAKNLQSEMTIPPFTNSAVDGFACKSEWTKTASVQNPLRFEVLKSLWPGQTPEVQTPSLKAWAIMTGAPLPLDCDACVKIEDTQVKRNAQGQIESFEIRQTLGREENLRGAGEDFKPGQTVVSVGEVLRPEHLMALASLNIQTVSVFAKPRVVLVPTGQELVEPGQKLAPGQIYNSTQPFLRKSLEVLGCEVESAPIMRDEPEIFLGFMRKLMENPPDLLLTTGAVSMGSADFIRPAFEKLGAEILFHRIDIRPGKPILFARWVSPGLASKSFVAFGLPGNPVSSVVGLRFFIEPYLRALAQRPVEKPLQMHLAHDLNKPSDLRCFFKAQIEWGEGRVKVKVLKGQPSFMVHPLLLASVWAVLPEGVTEIKAGELIDVFPQGYLNV